MDKIQKCLLIFFLGIMVLPGILFLARISRRRYCMGRGENADKSMYEKLRESKMALEKATSLIQSALDGMSNQPD